jgi:hypothetical protein
MRTVLLALFVILAHAASAQPHEIAPEEQRGPGPETSQPTAPPATPLPPPAAQPTPPRTAMPKWSVTVVSSQRSNRYMFRDIEHMLRVGGSLLNDKVLFIMLHRDEELVERWTRPPE